MNELILLVDNSDIEILEFIMKNIEMTVEENVLIIRVDLTKEFGLSSSGKNIIIASTEGNVPIPGHEDAKVGLNVYRKK